MDTLAVCAIDKIYVALIDWKTVKEVNVVALELLFGTTFLL